MSPLPARPAWAAIHRYLGLTVAVFLLIAALTGCVLCVRPWLDATLNPDLFRAGARQAALSPMEAVGRLQQGHPELVVTRFPLRVRPGRTIEVGVAARRPGAPLAADQLFLDPHEARIVGGRRNSPGLDRRHILEAVFELHYTLLAGRWGRWLMGLAALGWVIGNGVGLYLTLPTAAPFWRRWRRIWTIDVSARLPRLMLDLHRASGLWLLIGLTTLAVTSVCMNFFDEAFTPAVSAISPARPSPFDRPPSAAGPLGPGTVGLGQALAAAEAAAARRGLHWRPAVESYLPDRGLYGVMFTPSGYESYRGLGPITYYFDGRSGRLIYIDDPYRDSPGRMVSRALYPLHTGEMVGTPGRAATFVLGLATIQFCVTGTYMWWRRRRSRRVG